MRLGCSCLIAALPLSGPKHSLGVSQKIEPARLGPREGQKSVLIGLPTYPIDRHIPGEELRSIWLGLHLM